MKVDIPDEMYEGLIELSRQINSQSNRATAMPYIFQVEEDEKVWDTGLNQSNLCFLSEDFDSCYELSEKGVREYCKGTEIELPEDIENIDQYSEWFEKHHLTVSSYGYRQKYSNAFFTAKGCKEHIEKNHYHYTKPRDFLSYAFRNPEMELVYKFLCGLTGEKMHK